MLESRAKLTDAARPSPNALVIRDQMGAEAGKLLYFRLESDVEPAITTLRPALRGQNDNIREFRLDMRRLRLVVVTNYSLEFGLGRDVTTPKGRP